MGIQINGNTDTISAVDGALTVSGAELPTVTNLNATGIVTATGFVGNITGNVNATGVSTIATLNVTQSNPTNLNVSGVTTTATLRATSIVGVTTAGITTAYIGSVNDGPISGVRNKIINGDMRLDQRNSGASVTPTGDTTYTVDRWPARLSQASKYSVQQVSDAPAGFVNSLKITSLSSYSVTSTDYFCVDQYIEGLNSSDLAWGTASAKTVTLSFWVKSSLTGTFGGSVFGYQVGYPSYVFSYSISAANTWEYKTITISGPTSGTFVSTNAGNIVIEFSFGVGSSLSGTAGTWNNSVLYRSATGAVSVVGTNAATWQITGVQLESGTVATPFERRSYGQELALCQRYCYVISGSLQFNGSGYSRYFLHTSSASGALSYITFPVQMRSTPTLVQKNIAFGSTIESFNYATALAMNFTTIALAEGDVWHSQLTFSGASGLTGAQIGSWRWTNVPDAYIGFSAEL